MTTILLADIHLNDKLIDDYRWMLLPWVAKYKPNNVIILGDLTDAKDNHSSNVVNRLADQLYDLSQANTKGTWIWILKGNHDYLDPDWPFFEFADYLPHVTFIKEASSYTIQIASDIKKECLFLPATKNWEEDWGSTEQFRSADYIFCHATFDGALSENGTQMRGFPLDVFKHVGKHTQIWAGDIHVPQSIGRVRYVGAPYNTRFGDQFEPRCILIDDQLKVKDIFFKCPRKRVIQIGGPQEIKKACKGFSEGDHVKVRVLLSRKEYPEWPSIRAEVLKEMQALKLEVFGPELMAVKEAAKSNDEEEKERSTNPLVLLRDHAKAKRVNREILKVGEEILDDTK